MRLDYWILMVFAVIPGRFYFLFLQLLCNIPAVLWGEQQGELQT